MEGSSRAGWWIMMLLPRATETSFVAQEASASSSKAEDLLEAERQEVAQQMRAQSESVPYLEKLKELAFEKPQVWQQIKASELAWQHSEEEWEWQRDMQMQQQASAAEAAAVGWSAERCSDATKGVNAAELELRLGPTRAR